LTPSSSDTDGSDTNSGSIYCNVTATASEAVLVAAVGHYTGMAWSSMSLDATTPVETQIALQTAFVNGTSITETLTVVSNMDSAVIGVAL